MSERWSMRVALLAVCTTVAAPDARAVDVKADLQLSSSATSNIYMDQSQEWDIAARPAAELALEFLDFCAVGYTGDVNAYVLHPDLLSHFHQVYLVANPAWGSDRENELVVEASVETLRNLDAYALLNYVRPVLQTRLAMEPLPWLRWQVAADGGYRWYYDDIASDSVDAWLRGQLTFMLPTHTAVIPGASYGFRYYPRQDTTVTSDVVDQQVEVGVHLGQGLWDLAGLQLDYGYRYAIGASGLLLRKFTESQFAYIGEEFFFSGHRAAVEFTQLFEFGLQLNAVVRFEQRAYIGWPALDATGAVLGIDRRDYRLVPAAAIAYSWTPAEEDSRWIPAAGARLEYAFVRQWSNSVWYDTFAHTVALQMWANW